MTESTKKTHQPKTGRRRRRHPILWILPAGAAIALLVLLVLILQNKYSIQFSIPDTEYIHVECGDEVEVNEVTATWQGTIFHRKPTPIPVTGGGIYSTQVPGTYTLTYEAEYKDLTASVQRIIQVVDTKAPELTLMHPELTVLPVGSEYTEAGYQAQDLDDGDITDRVTVTGTVDTGKVGTYELRYVVEDAAGNRSEATRQVQIVDKDAPVITLQGDAEISLNAGSEYSEPGYLVTDNADGDITEKVQVSSNVDTATPGTYEVTYSVTDSSGNPATASRTVTVVEVKKTEQDLVAEGAKIIYLTFDDGPGPYTQQLLDVLDQYGVKATFFVTAVEPNYYYLIGEAARRGHTIAIHTATHDYQAIYTSDEAYYADMNRMNEIIREQTGNYSHYFRFPGGSSNMVSANYSAGIMSRLAANLTAQGYQYFDWNVSSGDGASVPLTSEQIFANVTGQVVNQNVSMVLQHDTRDFSVNAVAWIIDWGIRNGYTFLPITDATTPVHHTIQN